MRRPTANFYHVCFCVSIKSYPVSSGLYLVCVLWDIRHVADINWLHIDIMLFMLYVGFYFSAAWEFVFVFIPVDQFCPSDTCTRDSSPLVYLSAFSSSHVSNGHDLFLLLQ